MIFRQAHTLSTCQDLKENPSEEKDMHPYKKKD